MTKEQAMTVLRNHTDADVLNAANVLDRADENRKSVLTLVRSSLGQVRLDMKYLMFDLEATRRERDELRGKV